jgi:hypothetical protein
MDCSKIFPNVLFLPCHLSDSSSVAVSTYNHANGFGKSISTRTLDKIYVISKECL